MDIENCIRLFRHYESEAKRCLEFDKDGISAAGIPFKAMDITQIYTLYDYNMEMAGIYEQAILSNI